MTTIYPCHAVDSEAYSGMDTPRKPVFSPFHPHGDCGREQTEPHECPFGVEINDDHRECTCCNACQRECADDI